MPRKRKNSQLKAQQSGGSGGLKKSKIELPSMHMLNDDCLEEVFRRLELQDLFKLEMVCKRFREITLKVYRYCTTLNCDFLLIYCKKNQQKHLEVMASKVGNYVENLKLSAEVKDNDSARRDFMSILAKCKKVKHFRISRARDDLFVSDTSNVLNRTFSGLKTLQLDRCRFVDKAGEYILKAVQLEELQMFRMGNIGSWFFQIRNLKKLLIYPLYAKWGIIMAEFARFCENNSNLDTISLKLSFNFNPDCFDAITSNLKNLQRAEFIGFNKNACQKVKNLKKLADLTKLKHLRLRGIDNLAPLMELLANRNILESLDVSFHPPDGDCDPRVVLWGISRLTRLKKLSTDYWMYDDILLNLDSHETLEEVSIVGSQVTDQAVCQFVQKCKKLTSLNLSGCPKLTSNLITDILPIVMKRNQQLTIFVGHTRIYAKSKNPKLNISRTNKNFSPNQYKKLRHLNLH
ncbi:uncharacterized protein DMENIID0001_159990 [Sergentomyia squamirostris]